MRRYLATHQLAKHQRLFAITPAAVDYRIKQAAKRVALPFTPSARTFRHSFAIIALLHACPPRAIQLWLGHKRVESTEIYTHVTG